MSKAIYKKIEDVPAPIREAYGLHKYAFKESPYAHARWEELDWINYVYFAPELEEMRSTLYAHLVAEGCEVDHHESDLYVKATEVSRAIIAQFQFSGAISSKLESFTSQIDGKLWYDIPFMYSPYWEGKVLTAQRRRAS